MEDLDELLKLEVPAFHGVRAAGRCADASLERSYPNAQTHRLGSVGGWVVCRSG